MFEIIIEYTKVLYFCYLAESKLTDISFVDLDEYFYFLM